MDYRVKATLQRVFSAIPHGEQVNYAFQRHVSRNLPRRESGFSNKIQRAGQHFAHFRRFLPDLDPTEAQFLELGAGWDLIIPFSYWCLGTGHQRLLDVRRNVHLELANNTIERLAARREAYTAIAGAPLRPPMGPVRNVDDLERLYGIRIEAPADGADTRLPEAAIDFISTTSTLEHVPPDQLAGTLREWRRILRPGGIASCHIDLKDHYHGFDRSISYYHFLTQPQHAWAKVNPPLHYQSRLRSPDYLRLVAESGLEVVYRKAEPPTPSDLELLRTLPVVPEFRERYSPEELGTKLLWLVLRKN